MVYIYKCNECGYIFDEEEIKYWSEERGEYMGQPAYEEFMGCPKCFGRFDDYEGENEEE